MGRAAAFCQRLKGVASVRSGHGSHTLPHISADGGGSRVADTADGAAVVTGAGVFLNLVDIGVVGAYHQEIYVVVVIAVFGRVVDEHFLNLLVFRRLEVVENRVPELIPGDFFLIID